MEIDNETNETNDTPAEDLSIRDAIEDAFDSHEQASETPGEAQEATQGHPEGEGTQEPLGTAPAPRERDEKGRFKPRGDAAEAAPAAPDAGQRPGGPDSAGTAPGAAQAGEHPGQPAGAVPPQELKAPQSWRPAAREAWGNLPKDVQEEVLRREHDISNKLNETTHLRRVGEGLLKAAQPYQQFIAAEGGDPVRAAASMFQTAALLRVGAAPEKASLIAQLVRQFGVDVTLLDNALAGQGQQYASPGSPPQAPPGYQPQPQPQPQGDPRLDHLLNLMQQKQATQAQQSQAAANQEVAQFGQGREFFEDVREHMADLIEVAERRGLALSLEDAYNQACMLHPEISRVMQQRQQAAAAGSANQQTQRARRAASSVVGSPPGAPPVNEGPLSRRQAIEAAMEQSGG